MSNFQLVETFAGYPLDSVGSYNLYIGRNVPNPEDRTKVIREVTNEELDAFFLGRTKIVDEREVPLFQGYTRIPCKGFWNNYPENSEVIVIFGAVLRDVIDFSLDYMEEFDQDGVYVDVLYSKQFLVEREV